MYRSEASGHPKNTKAAQVTQIVNTVGKKIHPGFFSSIWVRTMSRFLIILRKYFYIIVNTGAYFTTNLLILP